MKSKRIVFFLIYALLAHTSHSQNWHWVNQIGGSGTEGSAMMCMDSNGNIYMAGAFSSNPCLFTNDSLTPVGANDAFVAKYDQSGNEIWVKKFGGNNSSMQIEEIGSIVYNGETNSIFISGLFFGVASFDTTLLSSSGNGDGFIARLDIDGNIKWAKKAGGFETDRSDAMDVDSNGRVFVEYNISQNGHIDTNNVSPGVYIAIYDSSGICLTVTKKFNESGNGTEAFFTKLICNGNYIFGFGIFFNDTLSADTVTLISNFHGGQYMLGCMDKSNSLNLLWLKPISAKFRGIGDFVIDNDHNFYVSGAFADSAIFGLDTISITSSIADLFFTKYDSLGNNIWHLHTNATNFANGARIALDNENGEYVTGMFMGNAIFENDTVTSVPDGNLFIARFDSSGNLIGLRNTPGGSGTGITLNNTGDIFLCGNFRDTINFQITTLTSSGSWDDFIAKSDPLTGIERGEEERGSNTLVIYANPNQGTCNINIPTEFKHEHNLTISIYDNNAKLIQQGTVQMDSEKIRVNLEAEAKGIYNVTLSNGKKIYAGKIVFE